MNLSNVSLRVPPTDWGRRNYKGGQDIVWGGDPACEHIWNSYPAELAHENRQGLDSKAVSPKFGIHGKKAEQAGFCSLCGCWRGQLGLEPNVGLYTEHLMMIFKEVKRVLKKTGSFYLNLGSTYASSKATGERKYRLRKNLSKEEIKYVLEELAKHSFSSALQSELETTASKTLARNS